jgi:protein tyrosine phosphatase
LIIDEKTRIELLETKVLLVSEKVKGCEIVKRTFKVISTEQESTVVHYHYQGWKNKKGAPDSRLLSTLIKELGNNESQEEVITIHCAAGRGRSGNVVLADIFRKRMQAGTNKETITLNISEILMQGRLMRDGFVESAEQITSAFESAVISMQLGS